MKVLNAYQFSYKENLSFLDLLLKWRKCTQNPCECIWLSQILVKWLIISWEEKAFFYYEEINSNNRNNWTCERQCHASRMAIRGIFSFTVSIRRCVLQLIFFSLYLNFHLSYSVASFHYFFVWNVFIKHKTSTLRCLETNTICQLWLSKTLNR